MTSPTSPRLTPAQREDEPVTLPCLCCGKLHSFAPNSYEAQRVFNVFCDGECEDRYAARL